MYHEMKCPYCLKKLKNEDVLYKLNDAKLIGSPTEYEESGEYSLDAEALKNLENYKVPVPSLFDDLIEGTHPKDEGDDEELLLISESKDGKKKSPNKTKEKQKKFLNPNDLSGFYTINQLKNTFSNIECFPQCNGKIRAAKSDEPLNGDLITRIRLTISHAGKKYTYMLDRRYCKCERELHSKSGFLPTKVILTLGASNAGKTMYLISLYNQLKGKPFQLPSVGEENFSVNVSLSSVGDSTDDFENMESALYQEGLLPTTTIDFYAQPLCFRVGLSINNDAKKDTLMYIRDIPGEELTRKRSDKLIEILEGLGLFDGYIFFVAPETFDINETEQIFSVAKGQNKQLRNLIETTENLFQNQQNLNAIHAPALILVTKGDDFFKEDTKQKLENAGVTFGNPALNINKGMGHGFFDMRLQDGMTKLLRTLMPNTFNSINSIFKNTILFMGSVWGNDVKIEEGNAYKKVDPHKIKPWRIIESLMALFMRMGIVPPYDQLEVKPDNSSTETEFNAYARRSRNQDKISQWKEKNI